MGERATTLSFVLTDDEPCGFIDANDCELNYLVSCDDKNVYLRIASRKRKCNVYVGSEASCHIMCYEMSAHVKENIGTFVIAILHRKQLTLCGKIT